MTEETIEALIHLFTEEAFELLDCSEQSLLKLEESEGAAGGDIIDEGIGDLFRCFHTIKGSAGVFDIGPIVEFTHIVESILSKIRDKTLELDQDLLNLLLLSRDHLALMIQKLRTNGFHGLKDEDKNPSLTDQLAHYLPEDAHENNDGSSSKNADTTSRNWHISLRFPEDSLRNGIDPYSFIRFLRGMSSWICTHIIDDKLPDLASLQPDSCYLGFEISLTSSESFEEIKSVFEILEKDCFVNIIAPFSPISEYENLLARLPENKETMLAILRETGAITINGYNQLSQKESKSDISEKETNSSIAPAQKTRSFSEFASTLESGNKNNKKAKAAQKARQANSSVRVNAFRLEQLINLVGELVINGASADLGARKLGDEKLVETMENMSRLVEEIRDTTLGLRMVPIGETFSRLRRIVRESSKLLDKKIELIISGEETELDKTLIEKINDPLIHLLRNAVDHGIESTDDRKKGGKNPIGKIHLDAFHDSGNIVIRVKDDGAGLNKDKIIAKALSKGLISEKDSLDEKEIFNLIFNPGFSTAEKVTNLSGRGVGMDVVKRNIETLGGLIEVDSVSGFGTTFDILLPLTLAIIDGFEVSVGNSHFIIPLQVVEECIELEEVERDEHHTSHYINLRGSILPYLNLRDHFDLREIKHEGRENIVVVKSGGIRAGLVVDRLHGEHQTVIKPMGSIFLNLQCVSGATILSNGSVALILDIQKLVKSLTTPHFQRQPREKARTNTGNYSKTN